MSIMSEKTDKIVASIIKSMKELEPIKKDMTVGSGSYAYQGVSDKIVKESILPVLTDNGLCIIPLTVEPTTTIERWEEGGRNKQSVFTEVKTEYMLMHTSGQFIKVSGLGQGVDSQDKGAGKATTYALKNTLLYTFLIPTVKMDSDNIHSKDIPVPPPNLPWLNENTREFKVFRAKIQSGETTLQEIRADYKISKKVAELLTSKAKTLVSDVMFSQCVDRFNKGEDDVFEKARNNGYGFSPIQMKIIKNMINEKAA